MVLVSTPFTLSLSISLLPMAVFHRKATFNRTLHQVSSNTSHDDDDDDRRVALCLLSYGVSWLWTCAIRWWWCRQTYGAKFNGLQLLRLVGRHLAFDTASAYAFSALTYDSDRGERRWDDRSHRLSFGVEDRLFGVSL